MEQEMAEVLVRRAMAQASIAAARGDAPFGAVLASADGTVLLEAANAQASAADPTAHAEIRLIRDAAGELGRATLGGLVIASNAESCSMCASALVKARVATIVFGAPHEPHMDPAIGLAELVARSHHRPALVGPILADECAAQVQAARDATAAPD
jgi:tRNA(adenine34) deaminase